MILSKRATVLRSRRALRPLLLGLCLAFSGLRAAEPYLAAGHPDVIALLPPPPFAGSAEQDADLNTVRAVSKKETATETEKAKKDESLSFSLFVPAIGPAFDLTKLPKTEALLQKVKKEIGPVIDTGKEHWKRQRPYQLDPTVAPGKPEPSFSYPSGHSTRGTVYALVLAEIFPDKQEAIAQVGRDIGWDRVVLGKHYPSDILAGRVLAQAIVREMKQNPEFSHDLAEAKAEAHAKAEPQAAAH
jgi:acid phosphatase (class A)